MSDNIQLSTYNNDDKLRLYRKNLSTSYIEEVLVDSQEFIKNVNTINTRKTEILSNHYKFIGVNTVAGIANSTTAVGDGWIDKFGGIWNVENNLLKATTTDPSGWSSKYLLRPVSENVLNCGITVYRTALLTASQAILTVALRYQAVSNNHYLIQIQNGIVYIFKSVAGSALLLKQKAITFYTDGNEYSIDCKATQSTTPGFTSISVAVKNESTGITNLTIGFEDNEVTLQSAGQTGLAIWANTFTTAFVKSVKVYSLSQKVVFIGDSLTAGFGATSGYVNTNSIPSGTIFPSIVQNSLNKTYSCFNFGFSGAKLFQMLDQTQTVITGQKILNGQNIAVIFGGINDIGDGPPNGVASGMECYHRVKSLCENYRNAGFKVLVCTLTATGNTAYAQTVATINTRKVEANSYIRNNYKMFADSLCDLALNSFVGIVGAENNLTYFTADKQHFTDAGYKVIADLVSQKISEL
jgi:lysophospholipase L1-like esterase